MNATSAAAFLTGANRSGGANVEASAKGMIWKEGEVRRGLEFTSAKASERGAEISGQKKAEVLEKFEDADFGDCLHSCLKQKNPVEMEQNSSEEEMQTVSLENNAKNPVDVIPVEEQVIQMTLIQSLCEQEGLEEGGVIADADVEVLKDASEGEDLSQEANQNTEENILTDVEILNAGENTESILNASSEIVDVEIEKPVSQNEEAGGEEIIFENSEETSEVENNFSPVENEIEIENQNENDEKIEMIPAASDLEDQNSEDAENIQTSSLREETSEVKADEVVVSDEKVDLKNESTSSENNEIKTISSQTSSTNTDADENVDEESEVISDGVAHGEGRKVGLEKGRRLARGKDSETEEKYPNFNEGSENGIAHKILSHLKNEETLSFGTSYAEKERMSDLMKAWNEKNPELDALIAERTGLRGLDDLESVDQLRSNSWKNAHNSDGVKTEVMPKTWLKDVPEIITKALNSAPLALPKRIEIPLKTPEGSIIQLYLQESKGHIRAQISTNDKLVMEWANQELAYLKEIPFENNVKWTPPQFEQKEGRQEQSMNDRQQDQNRKETKQKDEGMPTFEEEIEFLDSLRRGEL